MELPTEVSEQIAFKTISKTEELMLSVLDKSSLGEHSSQPIQTNSEQNKTPVTFSKDITVSLM